MSKKKSYMDRKNLLDEGIFSSIANFLNRKSKHKTRVTDKDIKRINKKNKLVSKLQNNIDKMNARQKKMDAEFEKEFEVKLNTKPYSIKDFLK